MDKAQLNLLIERHVTEAFQSGILAKLNSVKGGTNRGYNKVISLIQQLHPKFNLKWSDLTDDYFEEVSPEQARSFNAQDKILFFISENGNEEYNIEPNTLIAITHKGNPFDFGNYRNPSYRGAAYDYDFKGNPNMKHFIQASDKIYAMDIEKAKGDMSAKPLQDARAAARKDALALQDLRKMIQNNRNRYKDILAKKFIQSGKIQEEVKKQLEIYNTFLTKVIDEGPDSIGIDRTGRFISKEGRNRDLSDVNSAFKYITEYYFQMIRDVEEYKRGVEKYGEEAMSWEKGREEIGAARIREAIKEFNKELPKDYNQ